MYGYSEFITMIFANKQTNLCLLKECFECGDVTVTLEIGVLVKPCLPS